MNDDRSLFDELAGDDEHEPDRPASRTRRELREERSHRTQERHSPLRSLLPLLVVLALLVGVGVGGVYGYRWLTGNVQVGEAEASDYPGPGTGKATVKVADGDSGSAIADKLVAAGVIKSAGPFTQLFANTPEASEIKPGTYTLKKQMSASGALDLLLDPSSRAGKTVTIPEGLRMSDVFARLSKETGIPVEDFEAAAKDYTALGIPENPAGSAEGYLWPGQYDIEDGATATDILTQMATRMQHKLEALGVPPEKQHEVLTLASIAEKEARSPEDYGKVVRTLENRLQGVGEAGGHPMNLQLDSTVAYAAGHSNISTTPEERASDSPYNTYVRPGLPVGPISNPGEATIKAALDPPEGPWLYWVTVNTDTGETKFAATKAEHDRNVQEWKDWAAAHGG